jgi:hypothetical protein
MRERSHLGSSFAIFTAQYWLHNQAFCAIALFMYGKLQSSSSIKTSKLGWAQWHTPVILALKRLRQEDHGFEGRLKKKEKGTLYYSSTLTSLYFI